MFILLSINQAEAVFNGIIYFLKTEIEELDHVGKFRDDVQDVNFKWFDFNDFKWTIWNINNLKSDIINRPVEVIITLWEH